MDEAHRPLALLRHVVPDRGAHFDLLLSTLVEAAADDRCVLAWRSTIRIEALNPGGRAPLEPLGRHRALYCSLSAPRELDDHRGLVTPLASGRWGARSDGSAILAWSPHRPPMVVAFRDGGGALDARDDEALARATFIERIAGAE